MGCTLCHCSFSYLSQQRQIMMSNKMSPEKSVVPQNTLFPTYLVVIMSAAFGVLYTLGVVWDYYNVKMIQKKIKQQGNIKNYFAFFTILLTFGVISPSSGDPI